MHAKSIQSVVNEVFYKPAGTPRLTHDDILNAAQVCVHGGSKMLDASHAMDVQQHVSKHDKLLTEREVN